MKNREAYTPVSNDAMISHLFSTSMRFQKWNCFRVDSQCTENKYNLSKYASDSKETKERQERSIENLQSRPWPNFSNRLLHVTKITMRPKDIRRSTGHLMRTSPPSGDTSDRSYNERLKRDEERVSLGTCISWRWLWIKLQLPLNHLLHLLKNSPFGEDETVAVCCLESFVS